MKEAAKVRERTSLKSESAQHDAVRWHCHTRVDKYDDDGKFLETVEVEGNLLMYGGASALWRCLTGNGSGTGGGIDTYFNNANAHIGVGDSTVAVDPTHNDLQAATNKLRKAMEATYPTVPAAGTASGNASIVFRSSFGTSEANFAWQEWGIFNGASSGRMLNRKVESLGTKSTGTWVLTVTLTLGS